MVGGLLIRYFSGLSFLAASGIVLAALLVNGWIATLEDDAPGGFNDGGPDPD